MRLLAKAVDVCGVVLVAVALAAGVGYLVVCVLYGSPVGA